VRLNRSRRESTNSGISKSCPQSNRARGACRAPSNVTLPRPVLKVVYYYIMYWYMCRLDAGHCRLVVNKGCRLSPSTSPSSLWFLLLAYIAPVVGINRTRRLDCLSPAYIALAVCMHRTHLLLIAIPHVNALRKSTDLPAKHCGDAKNSK